MPGEKGVKIFEEAYFWGGTKLNIVTMKNSVLVVVFRHLIRVGCDTNNVKDASSGVVRRA